MFNFWQSMSQEFQAELNGLINGEYSVDDNLPPTFPLIVNLSNETIELYQTLVGSEAVIRLFETFDHPNGKTYRTWSLYTNKPENAPQIRSDFDAMHAAYPSDMDVIGLWDWDGRPLGMQWVDPEDHSQGLTGTPIYETPSYGIYFMPDVKVPGPAWPDDPDDWTTVPATTMSDVHLLYGQAPRQFVDADGSDWGTAVSSVSQDTKDLFQEWVLHRHNMSTLQARIESAQDTAEEIALMVEQLAEMEDTLGIITRRLILAIEE